MPSSTTFDVLHVRIPAMPRGARVAAELFGRIATWLHHEPHIPTRGEEAAAVRDLAYSVQRTDPGFAADLFAAAARHEGLDD